MLGPPGIFCGSAQHGRLTEVQPCPELGGGSPGIANW